MGFLGPIVFLFVEKVRISEKIKPKLENYYYDTITTQYSSNVASNRSCVITLSDLPQKTEQMKTVN